MINNLIILLILFFILSFTITNYTIDKYQSYVQPPTGDMTSPTGYMTPPTGDMNNNYNYNCYSITDEISCNNKPGCYYDYNSHNCNNVQTTDGDNCHLSVSEFSCSDEDDCKWEYGKCKSTKSPEICSEIKNEVNCNNSNLNCIYDNSKSVCFNQIKKNYKNNYNYKYSDHDCNLLKKRGENVYCTYDKNNMDDESIYFNLNKVIDTDKKRFKTCYGSNCKPKQNTNSIISDSGCSLSKNRITCDMQDNCEYINYKCVRKE